MEESFDMEEASITCDIRSGNFISAENTLYLVHSLVYGYTYLFVAPSRVQDTS